MLKPLLITSSVALTSITGYLNYKCYRNRKAYKELIENEEIRDTTRPDNDFFGINWGSKADSLIMENINSGDLVFARKDCSQGFSPLEMVSCYTQKLRLGEEALYDTCAVAVRSGVEVNLISDHTGEITIHSYPDFISYPIFEKIISRKLEISSDQEFKKLFNKRMLLLYFEIENSIKELEKFEEENQETKNEFEFRKIEKNQNAANLVT